MDSKGIQGFCRLKYSIISLSRFFSFVHFRVWIQNHPAENVTSFFMPPYQYSAFWWFLKSKPRQRMCRNMTLGGLWIWTSGTLKPLFPALEFWCSAQKKWNMKSSSSKIYILFINGVFQRMTFHGFNKRARVPGYTFRKRFLLTNFLLI